MSPSSRPTCREVQWTTLLAAMKLPPRASGCGRECVIDDRLRRLCRYAEVGTCWMSLTAKCNLWNKTPAKGF